MLYCSLPDVKARLSGDVPTMSAQFDADLLDIIRQVSQSIDSEVRRVRAMPAPWSFVQDTLYDERTVVLATGQVPPSAGTWTLTLGASPTSALAYNAPASAVQSALEVLAGAGNVAVSGPVYGPFAVVFKGTRTGPQAALSGDGSALVPTASRVVVVATRDSVATAPYARRFTPIKGMRELLAIDDAVQVTAVSLLAENGSLQQALVAGTDYLTRPFQGGPITGLWRVGPGSWPDVRGGIEVTAYWGYSTAVPADVTGMCIVESVRAYLAARAGENDTIGVTPWGSVVTSKAFTDKTWATIRDYRLTGHYLG